ncbi:hypothetical protein BU17DRAFT_69656 [Hysterangium stoloniferum]|nr:hypothetical protein BU17DRAFT_69656 [Hysterangium stoloniferum]
MCVQTVASFKTYLLPYGKRMQRGERFYPLHRRTAGPSSIIGQGYEWAAHKIDYSFGKLAAKMGKGPEFPTKGIEEAFGIATDQKLKRLCDLYDLEVNYRRQPSSGCPRWDWDIDKLDHYCDSLRDYASPSKTFKTQFKAFKDIVRMVTCYPGLRRVFCRDLSVMRIQPEILWKRNDEDFMDDGWKLFRQLAASCIGEKDLNVTVIVEKVRPDEFGSFFDHSEGIVESLIRIAAEYLGGILHLPPFWVEERNKLTPAANLSRYRRNYFLVNAVLRGMDGWAERLEHSPRHRSDLPKWLKLSVDLIWSIKGKDAARFLPRSTRTILQVAALRKYLGEPSSVRNVSAWAEAFVMIFIPRSQSDDIPTVPHLLATSFDSASGSEGPSDGENEDSPKPPSVPPLGETLDPGGLNIFLETPVIPASSHTFSRITFLS